MHNAKIHFMKNDISLGLDGAVAEVFAFMLGVQCLPRETSDLASTDVCMTVQVEISGLLNGSCFVYLPSPAVKALALGLLGFPTEDTALVEDTAREMGNVIIGRWKSLRADIAASKLSVPFLVYKKEEAMSQDIGALKVHRQYTFSELYFGVQICLHHSEGVAPAAWVYA